MFYKASAAMNLWKEELLYREAESYVSYHQTSKRHCTRPGLAPNPNGQESRSFSETIETVQQAVMEGTLGARFRYFRLAILGSFEQLSV